MIVCLAFAVFCSAGAIVAATLQFVHIGTAALGRLKDWLAEHSPAIAIPLFLILGALLINSSVQAIQGPGSS